MFLLIYYSGVIIEMIGTNPYHYLWVPLPFFHEKIRCRFPPAPTEKKTIRPGKDLRIYNLHKRPPHIATSSPVVHNLQNILSHFFA